MTPYLLLCTIFCDLTDSGFDCVSKHGGCSLSIVSGKKARWLIWVYLYDLSLSVYIDPRMSPSPSVHYRLNVKAQPPAKVWYGTQMLLDLYMSDNFVILGNNSRSRTATIETSRSSHGQKLHNVVEVGLTSSAFPVWGCISRVQWRRLTHHSSKGWMCKYTKSKSVPFECCQHA